MIQQPSASLAPFDGAESGASEEGVDLGDGFIIKKKIGKE
jgi:hypothetical protein